MSEAKAETEQTVRPEDLWVIDGDGQVRKTRRGFARVSPDPHNKGQWQAEIFGVNPNTNQPYLRERTRWLKNAAQAKECINLKLGDRVCVRYAVARSEEEALKLVGRSLDDRLEIVWRVTGHINDILPSVRNADPDAVVYRVRYGVVTREGSPALVREAIEIPDK